MTQADAGPATGGWLQPVTGDLAAEGGPEKVASLFRTAFSGAPDGMAIVDGAGRILLANDALSRITGFAVDELTVLKVGDLVDPGDRDVHDRDHEALVSSASAGSALEVRLRRRDGSIVWTTVAISRDGDVAPVTYVYHVQELSQPRDLQGRFEYLLDHDHLTGLFNRHRFQQELDRELARQRRFGRGGAVLMMSLDGFKALNDRFGRPVGDELLRSLSAAIRERSRVTDVVARLRGDEFAFLLPCVGQVEAITVASKLRALVRGHVSALGDERARVTASVGIVHFGHLSDVELLALADGAKDAAREAGGDRSVVYGPGDGAAHSSRVNEANDLHRALDEGRFVLYCQPIWDLTAGRVNHYELLIRMQSEAGGELIAPHSFLHSAERSGLITAIDCWVVSRAVALIAEHERAGRRVRLAVNLSGRSIGDPRLSLHIDRELDASRVDPSSLVFELTETAAIDNFQAARTLTGRLHARGCQFALDDFSAGFASFYYLKNLPFDYIKIDGNFVRGLNESSTDQLIVSAIVAIAKGMGKKTVAEFVADQQTSDLVAAGGVDYAQGYHIARPRPVAEVLAIAPDTPPASTRGG